MEKWLILSKPALLIPVILAFILALIERIFGKTKGVLTIVSAVILLVCSALLFLKGADMYELIIILLIFLLINMGDTMKSR